MYLPFIKQKKGLPTSAASIVMPVLTLNFGLIAPGARVGIAVLDTVTSA